MTHVAASGVQKERMERWECFVKRLASEAGGRPFSPFSPVE
jgi:hypothetical protein